MDERVTYGASFRREEGDPKSLVLRKVEEALNPDDLFERR